MSVLQTKTLSRFQNVCPSDENTIAFSVPEQKQQGLVETNPGGLNGHMRKHYTLYN
jgi:hypothetical protein